MNNSDERDYAEEEYNRRTMLEEHESDEFDKFDISDHYGVTPMSDELRKLMQSGKI